MALAGSRGESMSNHFRTGSAQPWWSSLLTGLWLVLLVALAILVVSGFVSLDGWLPHVRASLSDIALIVSAVVAALVIRRVLLILNARRASAVEIIAQGSVPANVLAAFREALTSVYLSSPSTVPGQSAPQDFLSDVREVAAAKTTWGVALLAAAAVFRFRPYRVSCTATEDSADGLKCLTVEVVSGESKDVQVTTVCDQAWEGVVRRAACHVAAYVLPRTWQARHPPWTPWRRRQLDPDLFYHFHEARRLARADRLEESLSHFEQATALDPLNPYIRIEKATVLDELGLYIDAFATYVDVVTTESWYDRPLWYRYRELFSDRAGWDAAPRRMERSPNGHAALQLARYRAVCSLAASQRLAEQWQRHAERASGRNPDQPERSREACRVIAMLRPLLDGYHRKMLQEYKKKGISDRPENLRIEEARESNVTQEAERNKKTNITVSTGRNEESDKWLRRVMQFAAWHEAHHLELDYRWHRWRRWRRNLISQSAIRILPVWAAIQFRYVEIAQHRAGKPVGDQELGARLPLALPEISRRGPGGLFRQRQDEKNKLPDNQWPPSVKAIKAGVSWALSRRAAALGWLEHYNAACTFAVAMLTPELYRGDDKKLHFSSERPAGSGSMQGTNPQPDAHQPPAKAEEGDGDEKRLTEVMAQRHRGLILLAISELAQSVTSKDSQFAGISQPWLRRGDQDLNDLRVTESYATFVDRYLSPGASWPPVPPNVARLAISAHVLHLVRVIGGLRQARWEERAQVADSVAWADLVEEAEWWEHLRSYCRDYRDWRTRYRLITLARASCPPGSSLDMAIPTLQTDKGWLDRNPWPPATAEQQASELAPATEGQAGASLVGRAQRWLRRSDELDRAAQALIDRRNDILDKLAASLTTTDPLGKALARTARDRELAGSPPLAGSAVLLANAWRAITQDASLSTTEGASLVGPDHVERLRNHFGLNGP